MLSSVYHLLFTDSDLINKPMLIHYLTMIIIKVVDTTSKYIVQSKGIKNETDQVVVDAENLISGNNKSLVDTVDLLHKNVDKGALIMQISMFIAIMIAIW